VRILGGPFRARCTSKIYTWKSKCGGLELNEAPPTAKEENRRLKHLVADLSLDKEVLKAATQTNPLGLQLNGKI
jgi:hypothetical protein